ncbi:MAG TPA: hypothetical protein VN328_05835 [Thermodesulfovibrionales bacterium]|nr:hypothetical protein [Thermodesulfovibrionales bacterium]
MRILAGLPKMDSRTFCDIIMDTILSIMISVATKKKATLSGRMKILTL